MHLPCFSFCCNVTFRCRLNIGGIRCFACYQSSLSFPSCLAFGLAASTTDQGQNQLRVLPDQGSGAAPTVSHKHRRGKAVTKNTGQKFTGPTAEFAAAAAYENSRRYDLAIPLYDELVRGGSRARIASNVKFVDGTELRLGATCADEAPTG